MRSFSDGRGVASNRLLQLFTQSTIPTLAQEGAQQSILMEAIFTDICKFEESVSHNEGLLDLINMLALQCVLSVLCTKTHHFGILEVLF